VLVTPGDAVVKGQPLVRFDAAALIERRAAVAAVLESARALSKIPRAATMLAVDAHPEVIAVEEEYARVVGAFEQGLATRAELGRAAAVRTGTRRRIGASLARSTTGIGDTAETLKSLLLEIDRAIADREARAPLDGVVEILDLQRGDRVVPGGPAALLRLPREFICEFTVPAGTFLKAGSTVRAVQGSGVPIEAQVERVWSRSVPSALREDRAPAEETVAQARFSSKAPLIPGSAIRVELPE
jgi:multidrug efflux pump subunit AcrA (membrane-fusion protein)